MSLGSALASGISLTAEQLQQAQMYPQPSSFISAYHPIGIEEYKRVLKQKEEGKTMFANVKGYIEKHKDVIFTLGLVILVDHFLFKGVLRERIKGTLEGVLKKAENMIEHKEA